MELKGGLFGVRFDRLVASSQSDANSDLTREICQRVIATIQLVQTHRVVDSEVVYPPMFKGFRCFCN